MQLNKSTEAEILSDIERIRCDESLWPEKNFVARSEAIDFLEFHVIDRIHALSENSDSTKRMNELMNDAQNVRAGLEEVNAKLFHQVHTKISREDYRGQRLRNLINEHLDHNLNSFLQPEITGYDHLDLLLNGILNPQNLPAETKDREPEMVFYQKTPARIVFELIDKAAFIPEDTFFDLGSGLGQVVMLVNLFANIRSIGVEYETAFCAHAKNAAAELNLEQVEFINIDARDADYSTGTVFFLYTPFKGKMFRDIMHKLFREAKKRKIQIFSFGPCTSEIAEEEWLIKATDRTGELGAFRSV